MAEAEANAEKVVGTTAELTRAKGDLQEVIAEAGEVFSDEGVTDVESFMQHPDFGQSSEAEEIGVLQEEIQKGEAAFGNFGEGETETDMAQVEGEMKLAQEVIVKFDDSFEMTNEVQVVIAKLETIIKQLEEEAVRLDKEMAGLEGESGNEGEKEENQELDRGVFTTEETDLDGVKIPEGTEVVIARNLNTLANVEFPSTVKNIDMPLLTKMENVDFSQVVLDNNKTYANLGEKLERVKDVKFPQARTLSLDSLKILEGAEFSEKTQDVYMHELNHIDRMTIQNENCQLHLNSVGFLIEVDFPEKTRLHFSNIGHLRNVVLPKTLDGSAESGFKGVRTLENVTFNNESFSNIHLKSIEDVKGEVVFKNRANLITERDFRINGRIVLEADGSSLVATGLRSLKSFDWPRQMNRIEIPMVEKTEITGDNLPEYTNFLTLEIFTLKGLDLAGRVGTLTLPKMRWNDISFWEKGRIKKLEKSGVKVMIEGR